MRERWERAESGGAGDGMIKHQQHENNIETATAHKIALAHLSITSEPPTRAQDALCNKEV